MGKEILAGTISAAKFCFKTALSLLNEDDVRRHPGPPKSGRCCGQGLTPTRSSVATRWLPLVFSRLGKYVVATDCFSPLFGPLLQDGFSGLFRLGAVGGFSRQSNHSIRRCFTITIPTLNLNASSGIVAPTAKNANQFFFSSSGWDSRSLLA
ncbi:hypothetical protein J2790_001615 [Paenarthrobacter nicotinovorans]|uniref:hypothetical protein n=1 Tax=Micrococcaceae TaxID=1268 RepID=UPI0015873260|nr:MULTISPECIES: hypothetical protein [Micrococcaceae]MDR6436494.1 hypothetical protein [Paenarthrobacter nicotinovorans]